MPFWFRNALSWLVGLLLKLTRIQMKSLLDSALNFSFTSSAIFAAGSTTSVCVDFLPCACEGRFIRLPVQIDSARARAISGARKLLGGAFVFFIFRVRAKRRACSILLLSPKILRHKRKSRSDLERKKERLQRLMLNAVSFGKLPLPYPRIGT